MTAEPVTLRSGRRTGMTPAQLALWTSQRLAPDAPLLNMAQVTALSGPIDPERFVTAVDDVVRASDALRTVFDDLAGTPRATVLPVPPATTEVADLPRERLDAWLEQRIASPLRVDRCCYDSVLLRHGVDDWSWYVAVHHLVTDAVTSTLVYHAVAAAYHGRPVELTGAGVWQQRLEELRATPRWQAAAEHWRTTDQAPARTPLYHPDGGRTTAATRVQVALDDARRAGIEQLIGGRFRALGRDAALFNLTATLLVAWLHRLGDADELTIGVPLHLRDPSTRDVVGLCMELFPLTVAVEPGETFASLHAKVQRGLMGLLRHAQPGTSPPQRFDVVLNVITGAFGSFGDVPATTRRVHSGHMDPHHRLRVQLTDDEGDGHLRLLLDLSHGAAGPEHRRHAPGHVLAVLDAVLADPDAELGSFELCTAEERALLDAYRRPPPLPDPPPATTVVGWIRDALTEAGDRVVLEHGDRRLTGAEVEDALSGLAEWLRERGVGLGSRVGVRMPRSADAVLAIHAVLRAGAAFVPLDPAHPPARLEHQGEAAGLALVLDELPHPLPAAAAGATPPDVGPDDEAYVLFTSGSTGVPKGVPITHRGLLEYVRFAVDAYVPAGHRPVVPLFTSLSFDLTVTSLFLPLLTGGRMVVHENEGLAALAEIAEQRQADLVKLTPSHLDLLVRMLPADHPLGVLIVGGEQFGTAVADRTLEATGGRVRILNEYGPTEAVVGCMLHQYDPVRDGGPHVPVGRPAPGADVVLLDRYGRRTPLGAVGEMHLHRPGMTAGYLGGVDAERFVSRPEIAPHPLYRTGDVARMADPTTMVYRGRRDEQVKVRGMRLETGEVEAVLAEHPSVQRAVVRLWSPTPRAARVRHCRRCGLGDDVPGVRLDDDLVCSSCHAFDAVRPQTTAYFGTPADLLTARARARARRRGRFDCLHLLSGGKDSTYALYRLVELGFDVAAMTLDNGFISEEAKANVRRVVEDLGVWHRFVSTPHMPEVLRDSLERYSNVCNGCYKTIYTLGVNLAHELGAPLLVTGLSRGQLFETRLVPAQFSHGRFDPAAIDAAVLEARKVYHRSDDAVQRLLDTSLFDDDAVFEEVEFLDFYRYEDVSLETLLSFLADRAPWIRPSDTGRSTNCLINAAGIHTHLLERGFHNYAVPYAWDVRMGHKTRDEALDELDDDLDETEVTRLLAAVGYEPHPPQVLTAWYTGEETDAEQLRAHLAARLPEHAVPLAFVAVDELPLNVNGKVAVDRLPPPTRFRRGAEAPAYRPPATPVEAALCELWSEVLGIDQVGTDEDFFALGGASLAALEVVVRLSERFGVVIPESAAFEHRTVAALAVALEGLLAASRTDAGEPSLPADAGEPSRPAVGEGPPALSDGQRALLYEHDQHPDTAGYNVCHRYRIRGPLDAQRLEGALRATVARHEALHRSFAPDRAVLPPEAALSFRTVACDEPGLESLAGEEARTRIDLRAGPLVRAVLAELGDDDHGLVLTLHHVSCDAASLSVLWRDLGATYAGHPPAEAAAGYAEVAARSAARVTPGDVDAAVERLRDAPVLRWPFPPATDPDELLAAPAAVRVDGLPGAPHRPLPAVLALLAGLLAHLGEHDDVVVGVTSTTRDQRDAAGTVGYFLNVLPIRLTVDPALGVRDLVQQADRALAAALDHRQLPWGRVAAALGRAGVGDPVRVLLVQEEDHGASLPGCTVDTRVVFNGSAAADLTVFVRRRPDGGLDLSMEHDGSVLDAAAARTVLHALTRLVTAAATAPDAALLDLLRTSPPAPAPEPAVPAPTVTHAVLDHARAHPGDPAVRCGSERLTHGALVERAARLAEALERAGVGRGDHVALVLPRSVDLVAAVLATHLLGAAYVPVDAAYPEARVRRILELARPSAVVAGDRSERVAWGAPVVVPAELDATAASPMRLGPDPDDPAYVIFTSGSTGVPRGVRVRHRQLAASTFARGAEYPERPERFLLLSSPGFDSSVAGLFWTLATGGELVVPTEAEAHDPDRLLDLAERAAVTHLLTVPSLHAALLGRRPAALGSLRQAIVAGEACPPALVAAHHAALPGCRLANEYGPTETTVWASVHHVAPGDAAADAVPIGHAVPGTALRVADRWGLDRPDGAAGELLIGGAGVTEGYLDDPEATAERFVTDPDGRRWYRSGDRVRRQAGGALVFLGRIDGQLSVGGLRIEPEEVETVLLAEPGVGAAVVVVAPAPVPDPFRALAELGEDAAAVLRSAAAAADPARELHQLLAARRGLAPQLVALVEGDHGVDRAALRRRLQERLPRQLVPARIEVVPELPRTGHGKVDRQAAARLPVTAAAPAPGAPGAKSRPGPGQEPDDRVVGQVVTAWRRVLGDPDLGPDHDFFASGGDSLTAIALLADLESRLGVHLPVTALLGAPTPRRLAALVVRAAPSDANVVELRAAPGLPLFLLPTGYGHVFSYNPLLQALPPDLPLYGFTAPGGDGTGEPLDSVEAHTDLFLELLLSVQPSGPYRLLGWSTGGLFAYDLARRLREDGHEVSFLGLVDTIFPGITEVEDRTDAERYRQLLADEGVLGVLRQLADGVDRRWSRLRRTARIRRAQRQGRPIDALANQLRMVQHSARVMVAYRAGPLDSRVVLFAAADTRRALTVEPWTELVPHLEVVLLEGTHTGAGSLMDPDRVEQLAEALLTRLR